jgi:hypothetical protein
VIAAASAARCADRPERPILGQFFASSRLGDLTALGGFATVWFDPRTDGIVDRFEITRVDPERRRPLPPGDRLIELSLDRASLEGAPRRGREKDRAGASEAFAGACEAASKEVTIAASVRLPRGRLEQRTLIVTMERAIGFPKPPDMAAAGSSGAVTGRWIITGFRVAPARP